eukprot:1136797-Pelagomonas_calceolata.AAC.1
MDRNNYYGGESASLSLTQVRGAALISCWNEAACCCGPMRKDIACILMRFLRVAAQLYERFRPGQPVPKELGPNRDWNVDLVPKFMMANGKLVRRGGGEERDTQVYDGQWQASKEGTGGRKDALVSYKRMMAMMNRFLQDLAWSYVARLGHSAFFNWNGAGAAAHGCGEVLGVQGRGWLIRADCEGENFEGVWACGLGMKLCVSAGGRFVTGVLTSTP